MKHFAEKHSLAIVNTFFQEASKPTYYGPPPHRGTRLDFFLIPIDSIHNVISLSLLNDKATRLQLIPGTNHRDHIPVSMTYDIFLPTFQTKEHIRWDKNKLADAVSNGGRSRFLFCKDVDDAVDGFDVDVEYHSVSNIDDRWPKLVDVARS